MVRVTLASKCARNGSRVSVQSLDERFGKANSAPRSLHSRIAAIQGAHRFFTAKLDHGKTAVQYGSCQRPAGIANPHVQVWMDSHVYSRSNTRTSLVLLWPTDAYGNRQGLEICRKLDLPGVRNLALEFVCDFQTAPVHAAARRCRAWSHIRTEVRIIFPSNLMFLVTWAAVLGLAGEGSFGRRRIVVEHFRPILRILRP